MSGKLRDNSTSGPMPPARVWKALYLFSAAVLALTALGAVIKDVPVSTLTRDMATTVDVHPFTGALTFIGILIWTAAAAICFFTSLVHRRRGERGDALFLFCAGLLTAWLVFDDLFLLHEELGGLHLRLSCTSIIITHFVLTALYLVVFITRILDFEYLLLAAAFAFFALSLTVDCFSVSPGSWWYLVEDGSKFFGIVSWSAFFARASLQGILRSPGSPSPSSPPA